MTDPTRFEFRRIFGPEPATRIHGQLLAARGIVLAASFQISISFAWVLWFSRTFSLGKRIVALHLCVVTSLLFVTFLSLGLLRRLVPRIKRSWAQVAVFAVIAGQIASLLFLYVADSISSSFWNGNLPWYFFRFYFLNAVRSSSIPFVETWALPALAMILAVAAALSASCASPVLESLDQLFLDGCGVSLFDGRQRTRATVALFVLFALGMCVAVGAVTSYPSDPRRSNQADFERLRLLRREPILALFAAGASVGTIEEYELARCFAREEPPLRASYPRGQAFHRKNVVLITVDSLRTDHMQIYGYQRPTTPFLAELVHNGRLRLVDRAIATCPESTCGTSSILTSKFRGSMVPENFSLLDLLHDQGYELRLVLSDDQSYFGLREVYGDQLTTFFDGGRSKRYAVTDDRLILEGLEGVPQYHGTPTFFYFHLMSAHFAGVPLPAFERYLPAQRYPLPGTVPDAFGDDPRQSTLVANAYDNGVLQADSFLRDIFDWLQRSGYLDEALVVITGDHGEGLGERGYSHGFGINQESVSVPLAFYDDPAAEYGALTLAGHVDIAPTVVARLGLMAPSNWQGQSLLDHTPIKYAFARFPDGTTKLDVQKTAAGAIFHRSGDETYQYIHDPSAPPEAREELYELSSDPMERRNLAGTAELSLIEDLRSRLAEQQASVLRCSETADAGAE